MASGEQTRPETSIVAVLTVLEGGFNSNELDLLDDFVAEDVVDHTFLPLEQPGPEGFKKRLAMLRAAFGDAHVSMRDFAVAAHAEEGDVIMWRWSFVGTHTGEILGLPPTGRRVEMEGVDIERVRNGKIVEHWSFWDRMTLMTQLGLGPDADATTDDRVGG